MVIGADSSLYMFFQNADMEWPLRGDLHRFSFYLDWEKKKEKTLKLIIGFLTCWYSNIQVLVSFICLQLLIFLLALLKISK